MSMKEVSRQLTELSSQFKSLVSQVDGLDQKFVGLDKKFDGLDKKVDGLEKKFDGLEEKFDGLEKKFDGLDKKVDDGFSASKVRDEELRDLAKFGLEAREALRESMENRFDEADRKHNQQIDLLNDAVRYLNSHK